MLFAFEETNPGKFHQGRTFLRHVFVSLRKECGGFDETGARCVVQMTKGHLERKFTSTADCRIDIAR